MPTDKVLSGKKVCPECGVDLSNRDLKGHMLSHYPEVLDTAKSSKEARNRQQAILNGGVSVDEFEKTHEKEG